jgi:hypothetical protein
MKKVTPSEFLTYRRMAVGRFKRKTGRSPTERQLSYWSRGFQIKRQTVSRQALSAIQDRLKWQYSRKTGKPATQQQLNYWTRGFKAPTTGIPVKRRRAVADMVGPKAGDRYRFTYEVGGYVSGSKKYQEIRVVRYGPNMDSWDPDQMEELVPPVYYGGGFADASFGVDPL